MVDWRSLGLVVLLSLPFQASADWLQEGADGAKSSVTAEPGPTWGDVALELQLEATDLTPARATAPLFVNGTMYVFAPSPGALGTCELDADHRILAIPLATLDEVAFQTFTAPACNEAVMASDGDRLFAAKDGWLRAYALSGAGSSWELALPLSPAGEPSDTVPALGNYAVRCESMAVDSGRVHLACIRRTEASDAVGQVWYSVDAATGTDVRGPTELTYGYTGGVDRAVSGRYEPSPVAASYPLRSLGGIAVSNGMSAVSMLETTQDMSGLVDGAGTFHAQFFWLIDASGKVVKASQLGNQAHVSLKGGVSSPIWWGDEVAVRRELYVMSYDPAQREWTHSNAYPEGLDPLDEYPLLSSCARSGTGLACPFVHRLVRLDADLATAWAFDLPDGQAWSDGHVVSANGTIYGLAQAGNGHSHVWAVDERTGEARWSHALDSRAGRGRLGVSDGVIGVVQLDGLITILGELPASPRVSAHPATVYPRDGDRFHVNLVLEKAGLGAPTAFGADWGTGEGIEWQESPRFEHRYSIEQDFAARFYVRNAFNQTASVPLEFFVGQHDPAITAWNHPFDPEYENRTYFFLGLIATALVAAFGFYRTGRKRRLFHAELKRLDDGYKSLEGDARACDAMLGEAKSRARALFLEKKLEEAHASFLERRVDELRKGLRLGTVEDKLSFLPHGMVVSLQRLLADARVDEWERKHFIEALEKEKDLSSAQRATARKVIDDWFARDAARS